MAHQSLVFEKHQPLLEVREGMSIYDWDDKKVGIVRYIQFPNGSDDTELHEKMPYLAKLDKVPGDIQAHLLREGFIFVEGGLFTPDRYILPEQILEVDGRSIVLNVLKSELIQF